MRGVDADDESGFFGKGRENPAVAASQFQEVIFGTGPVEDVVYLCFEVLLNPSRGDFVTLLQAKGGELFFVVSTRHCIIPKNFK